MSGQDDEALSFILEYSDLLMSMSCKQSSIIVEHGFNESNLVLYSYFDRSFICII